MILQEIDHRAFSVPKGWSHPRTLRGRATLFL